ncbi:glycosyltransferase [Scytonema sp. UIC 10036]|uniref:glycosyltransferase n=1 Tax=Scytonema sp. UIC 10036 TaxID=2304196 RepID=UPI0012DAE73D|nr:glycosyltransferase [Scytonema sp. UIC 10036]MUG96873.1 glycosyltransferase [Scytonema sp. UIC 10036]
MRILYLTTVLPSERKTGGEIASESFIDALKQCGYQVLVVGYQRQDSASFHPKENEIVVGQRYIETGHSKFYPLLWMGLAFLKRLPYSSAKYYSSSYIKKAIALLNKHQYDIAIVDHAQLGWLLPFINTQLPLIFIAHNIEREVYHEQFTKTTKKFWKNIYKRETYLIEKMEENLARTAREVWTFTSHDAEYFSTLNAATRVFCLPASFHKFQTSTVVKKCDIGIIGSWTWKANLLGLKWFLESVYPLLPGELSIEIAGKGAEWVEEQYPNVKYRGFVSDAQKFMEQARVIAIPSISGGGVQIKTLDAIASGTPIVATPKAMRGISNYPSSTRVAEKPENFANHLMQILTFKEIEKNQGSSIVWSQQRQQKFLAEIADCIGNL